MKWMRPLSGLFLLLLLACTATAGTDFPNPFGLFGRGKQGAPSAAPAPERASGGAAPFSFAPIVRGVKPAVVNVSTTQTVRPEGPGRAPGANPQDPFSQ